MKKMVLRKDSVMLRLLVIFKASSLFLSLCFFFSFLFVSLWFLDHVETFEFCICVSVKCG